MPACAAQSLISGLKMPNLFLVGAMKAGTTTLFNLLKSHPDIYMSPIKEPNFFSTDIDKERFIPAYKPRPLDIGKYCQLTDPPSIHSAYITTWEHYYCLFKNAKDEKFLGEASTSYLYSEIAAMNIRDAYQDARIIIVLRNPVDRAYSQYKMDFAIGRVKGSFYEEVKKDLNSSYKGWGISRLYIELGLYFKQVTRFLNCFPKHQVLIFLLEDMKRQDNYIIDELSRFLEIDRASFLLTDKMNNPAIKPRFKKLNYFLHNSNLKSLTRKIMPQPVIELSKKVYYGKSKLEKVSNEDFSFLSPYFSDDIINLSRLINRDLSHWRQDEY